jgi:RNA polymerase sigma-70 factor (ECF subfamily)
MAWRYCRDRARAEELAQEAFVRAWRGLGQWRRESSFSTWLFALASNVFRSDLKRVPTTNIPIEAIIEPAACDPGRRTPTQIAARSGKARCAGAAFALSRSGAAVLFS